MLTQTPLALGPAKVVETQGLQVVLETPSGTVIATLALATFYAPVPGDIVLAIGQEDRTYVIGVLHAQGPMVIQSPGDLTFIAPNGTMNLFSTRGITIHSPHLLLRSVRLEVIAKTVFEKFEGAYRWVKDAFQLRVGRMRTVSKGNVYVKGERIVQLAVKDVKIDGENVNLG